MGQPSPFVAATQATGSTVWRTYSLILWLVALYVAPSCTASGWDVSVTVAVGSFDVVQEVPDWLRCSEGAKRAKRVSENADETKVWCSDVHGREQCMYTRRDG